MVCLLFQAILSASPLQPDDAAPAGWRVVEKGERHSGNNFLQELLSQNFVTSSAQGGCRYDTPVSARYFCCWTHGVASDECSTQGTFEPPPTVYVTLVRNPYAWLLAMYRQPYETDGPWHSTFGAFLRAPFSYGPDSYKGVNAPHHTHPNPVRLWGAKVASYLALQTPHVLVRHDDLYDEPTLRATLETLVASHGVPRADGRSAVVYPAFTEAGNDNHNRMFTQSQFDEAKAYEARRGWASAFSQADLDFVGSQLDAAQMSTLGFEVMGAAAKPSETSALASEPATEASEPAKEASEPVVGRHPHVFLNYTSTGDHVFAREHEALHFMDLGWKGLRWA